MKSAKQRLDQLLHERGLAASREKSKALILAGQVLVNSQKIDKAGALVPVDSSVELLGVTPFVSRGGLKLQKALDHWQIDPAGWVCLDIGASTGGFTDCLLQRGAARVHAVDVGPTQMDFTLRQDPRVILHEHTNARTLAPEQIGENAHLLVCDVSFISVTLLLPRFPALLQHGGAEMVILVKPQFEVGREEVGKGGIVRDSALHDSACRKVEDAVKDLGFSTSLIESPVLGREGNKEFLLHARN